MAGESLIGSLAVLLTMDTAAFEKGTSHAQRLLAKTQREFEQVGKKMQRVGRDLSTYLTVPILAVGAGALKMAGDFESSMGKVAISTQASADEMKNLKNLALEIGKSTVFGASEAANAFDDLAKTGLTTKQILEGAGKATADLAAAAGSELSPAATAIADTMNQFKLTTKDLPLVVNQITGAVNQSKLSFEDYQLAIAQAGGVAGGLGVNFKDFNAAIAGTSSLFASGSDAGTSFKTFLTSLVPKSNQAAEAMEKYGLKFFDVGGKMKTVGEIAEMLKTKLGGLSQEAKNDVLKTIFGTDAMRTAIGLMDQGAAGLDKIAAKIASTDAAAQSAQRMKGFNAQLEQLGGALETLAIRLGDSGLLAAASGLVIGFTGLVDKLGELSPVTLAVTASFAGLLAAAGPLWLVFGTGVRAVGLLIPLLVKLGPAFVAAKTATVAFAPSLFALGPALGIAAAAALAVYAAYKNWDKIAPFIQGVVDRTTKASADINAKLKTIQDGANSLDQRLGIPSQQQFIASILSAVGGAVAKVNGWLAAIQKAATDFDRAVNTAFQNAGAAIQRMVAQAGAALRGLQAPFDWVRQKAAQVGDAFRTLYDRVVGNSYVPDMVDEIGQHMARLDANMVAPVTAATKKSGEAFKALQDRVSSLLARLFPEQAQNLQFLKDLQDLKTYADQAGWSIGQLEEAMKRLHQQTFDLPDVPLSEDVTNAEPPTPNTEIDWEATSSWVDSLGPKIDGLTEKTGAWGQALEGIGAVADRALNHFADGLTDIIMNSDSLKEAWKNLGALFHDIATQIVADLINIAIKQAILSLVTSGGSGGFSEGGPVGFASGGFVRGPGGPKADLIPAMLSNGEYVINAKATKAFLPLLEQINRGGRRFATGGMVSRQPISDRIQIARGGEAVQAFAVASPVHFDLRGAVMTQDLLNQMNEMSARAADQGANLGVRRMQDLNQRTFGRAMR